MNIKSLQQIFHKELASIYPTSEIRSFFKWLVEPYLKIDPTQLLLCSDREVLVKELQDFTAAIAQLKQHKPIQYILGETEFFSLRFEVNEAVLIPRPETEQLVDWVLKDYQSTQQPIYITEIGTGSGCIAISLAKNNLQFHISAIDISAEALAVATHNANLQQVNVSFMQQDILKLDQLQHPVDVIVSNPPYVRYDERHMMQANVLDYEPHLALFVKDDSALIFYEKIIALALQQKNIPDVYVEISANAAKETKALFTEAGFSKVFLEEDIFGKPRMIKAKF